MKKLYVLFLLASIQASAQDYAKQISWAGEQETDDPGQQVEVIIKKNNGYTPGYLNNIPAAVMSSFTANYGGATHVTCFIDDKLCTLSFSYNKQTIIIKYQPDGYPVFTRKTYSEDELEVSIIKFLSEQVAPSFKIKYVTELQQDENLSYQVNLSDEKQWMIVKLVKEKNSGKLQLVSKKIF